MYQLIYADEADKDLTAIYNYIACDSAERASKFLGQIENCILQLRDFPDIGIESKYKELRALGIRVLPYENILFSHRLMTPEAKFGIATNSYHVYRALVIAKRQGLKCVGFGAKTRWYFTLNAFMREYIAYLRITYKLQLSVILALGVVYMAFCVFKDIIISSQSEGWLFWYKNKANECQTCYLDQANNLVPWTAVTCKASATAWAFLAVILPPGRIVIRLSA